MSFDKQKTRDSSAIINKNTNIQAEYFYDSPSKHVSQVDMDKTSSQKRYNYIHKQFVDNDKAHD